jgi:hypothetical protein
MAGASRDRRGRRIGHRHPRLPDQLYATGLPDPKPMEVWRRDGRKEHPIQQPPTQLFSHTDTKPAMGRHSPDSQVPLAVHSHRWHVTHAYRQGGSAGLFARSLTGLLDSRPDWPPRHAERRLRSSRRSISLTSRVCLAVEMGETTGARGEAYRSDKRRVVRAHRRQTQTSIRGERRTRAWRTSSRSK